MHRIRRLSVALTVAGVLGVAAPAAANATPLVTISGATSSYPLVDLLANKYVKLHPHKVRFKITQGGTTVGLANVKDGSDTIADVAQEPNGSDAGLVFYPIAKYAICVVTNKSNPVTNLTPAQVTSIFTGKTKTWSSALGGATASGPIEVFTRTSVAGVLTSFKSLLLEGKSVESAATEESTEGQLRQAVESAPDGIGFLSNYQANKGGLNAVEFNGVACDQATAASGQYQGVADFYEVTKGDATGAAASFINWIDKSPAAKKIIASQWILIG
ncbi:MAG TPA: substrate-binding domain-containing protein [Solirubrobacteraceae bacterium]|jgi:phosphate transport system substrate-binding protein|nr:substrate-binding domain-containing protein [Solirubrobacteraceae bacterium]